MGKGGHKSPRAQRPPHASRPQPATDDTQLKRPRGHNTPPAAARARRVHHDRGDAAGAEAPAASGTGDTTRSAALPECPPLVATDGALPHLHHSHVTPASPPPPTQGPSPLNPPTHHSGTTPPARATTDAPRTPHAPPSPPPSPRTVVPDRLGVILPWYTGRAAPARSVGGTSTLRTSHACLPKGTGEAGGWGGWVRKRNGRCPVSKPPASAPCTESPQSRVGPP